MRVVLLLLIVKPCSRSGPERNPHPAGPPAGPEWWRAERQQITQNRRVHRPQFSRSAGWRSLPGSARFLEKRLFVERRRGQNRAISPLPARASRRFRRRWRTTRPNVAQLERRQHHRNVPADARRRAPISVEDRRRARQSTVDSALASERSPWRRRSRPPRRSCQIAEINLGLLPRSALRSTARSSATDVTRGQRRPSPTTGNPGEPRQPGTRCMCSNPVSVARAGLDLRKPLRGKRAASAQSCLRSACRMGGSTDRPVSFDYVSPTVATNTDTIIVRGVVPKPAASPECRRTGPAPRELFDGEFVTVMVEGVEPITVLRHLPRPRPRCCRISRVITSTSSTRQNKAEQAEDPARPVDPIHGRGGRTGSRKGSWSSARGLQRVRPGQTVFTQPGDPPPPAIFACG